MKYKRLGRKSGLRVSELALGTGNFGTGWGHGAEPAEAKKIFDGYVNAGGNFLIPQMCIKVVNLRLY